MKKLIVISISILYMSSALFAQNAKSDFSEILPKKGEYSMGLDMANMIQFVGNSFSANGMFSYPNYNMVKPALSAVTIHPTVFGKYFLLDNLAIRTRLGVGVHNLTERAFIYDDVKNIGNPLNNNPLTYEQTVDESGLRTTEIELGIGAELRKTLWRVQAYAGAEIFGSFTYKREYFAYGNAFSATNQTPTTYDFIADAPYNPNVRILDIRGGNTFHYGGGLYAGVDLFVAKNISIGAEFDLFIYGAYTTEEIGFGETWKMDKVFTVERKLTPYAAGFDIKPVGFLNMNIYF